MTALQAQIDDSLVTVNRGASTAVDVEFDVKQNRLVLRIPSDVTPAQKRLAEETLSAYPDQVVAGSKTGDVTFRACNGPWCDPPLRGGVGLIYAGQHGCTAGFVVASSSDGKRYLTTQRHCLSDSGGWSGTWYSAFSDLVHHAIGAPHNWNDSDLAILNIDNPGGWNPNPYIRYSGNELYPISSAQIPVVGARTCMSGSHSWGTYHCGTITYGLATRSGITNTLRAQLDTCPVSGDSGGPYFSYGAAQGMDIGQYGSTGCGGSLLSSLAGLTSMNVRMLVTG